MSNLSEFKEYIADIAEGKGHQLGHWHWAGVIEGSPTHEVRCEVCKGLLHLFWDQSECMWQADGDLVVLDCDDQLEAA
jgi:hypothetical protein